MKDSERDEANLLHDLEGVGAENREPPKYKQRATISTKLQNALITRRAAKDYIETNQILLDFVESDIGKNVLNQLKQVLGKTRKKETDMSNRIYYKRDSNTTPKNHKLEENLKVMIGEYKKNKK